MKKMFVLTMMAVLISAGALLAVEDDFHITVTVDYLEMVLRGAGCSGDYGTWALDQLGTNTTATMTTGGSGDHICVDNGSNVTTDFSAWVTSAAPSACGYGTPTAWTAGGAPGADTYQLELGYDDDGADLPLSWTTVTAGVTSGDVFYSSVGGGTNFHLFAQLTTPTSVSDGCPHDIHVRIVALP